MGKGSSGHWAEQIRPVNDDEHWDDDPQNSVDEICGRQRRAEDYARAVGAHFDERPRRAKAGWGR